MPTFLESPLSEEESDSIEEQEEDEDSSFEPESESEPSLSEHELESSSGGSDKSDIEIFGVNFTIPD